jgi:uncharacterized Ntn-hydrolase superfamily protein
MTFTITAWDRETRSYGICIATNTPAVGSRCVFGKSRVGAVAFQSTAEQRLGALGLKLLKFGYSAPKTLADLLATDPFPEKRQIAIIDRDGAMAAHTGDQNNAYAGHIVGDSYIAMGNYIVSEAVNEGIAKNYDIARKQGASFVQSLMHAIEGGRDAGGQEVGHNSAAIMVYGQEEFADLDLRVDLHDEPVGELRRLVDWYEPLIPYYNERVHNPHMPRAVEWLKARGIERRFNHG